MKRYLEPAIHFLIWVMGFLGFALGVKTIGVFHKSDGSFLYPLISGTLINVVLFYVTSLLFIPKFAASRKTAGFVLKTAGLLIGLTVIESSLDYAFFTSLYSSADESFSSQLMVNLALNIIVLSLALAYGFIKNWIRNERMKQRLKEEKLTAELNFLKAQINPHFLFNVLNMAFSSATISGDDKTAGIIEKLASLMRYMLYESNTEKVDLGKEIRYIEDYIELQKQRLSTDIPLTLRFEVDGDFQGAAIAPLLLIPFVENAFKYGIKFEHKSEIFITMKIRGKELTFRVENTCFPGHDAITRKDSGIGLENVKKRLAMVYPDKHQLYISDKGEQFRIELTLKLN